MDSEAVGVKAGVLLCERPAVKLLPTSSSSAVFINHASALEKLDRQGLGLGLNPIRKVHVVHRPRKASKPSALDKHRRHVALLQRANRQRQADALQYDQQEAAAQGALSAFSAQLRSAIMAGEDVSDVWSPAARADTIRQQQQEAACTVRDVRASLPQVLDVSLMRTQLQQQPQWLEQGDGAERQQKQQQLADELELFVDEALQAAASRAEGAADGTATSGATADGVDARQCEQASSSGQGMAQTRPGTSCSTRSAKGSKARAKPAWALTEEEAADQAAAEEEELLSFAEELDWSAFVDELDDAELQTAFQALQAADQGAGASGSCGKEWRKCFVRAMNHIAIKDVASAAQGLRVARGCGSEAGDDVASEGGHSTFSRTTEASRQHAEGAAARRAALLQRLSAAAGGSGWDASTRVGDSADVAAPAAVKVSDASEFLKDNPDVRSVHSAASVRSLLLRTEAQAEGQ